VRPLAPLSGKVVCFHVRNQFRGVHHRRHTIPPCPRHAAPRGWGLPRAEHAVRRHGRRGRGRDRAHLFSLIMPCASRSPRGRCACAVRTAALQGRLRTWAPMPSEQSKHYARAYGRYAGACIPWQSSRSVRGVGRTKRRGAKSALPICGHPAHGWAPPAVGTPGEGGDDHRQRRRAAPWSRHERQPAPWAVRGVSSSGQDAHASRPAASWYGRRRCWRACRSGVAGAFSSAAPAGQSGGPPLGPLAAAVGPSWRPRARPPAHGRARRGAGPTPRVQPGLAPMRADEPTGRAWLLA